MRGDASRGGAVVDHQKIVADAADITLAVGRSNTGIGADIQLQRVFGGKKPFIKVSDHNIFSGFCAGNKGRLVLRRIDQGNRLVHIIESGYAHTGAQRSIIRDISAGGEDEVDHSIYGAEGYHLVAAFAAQRFDPFNNARNSGIISRRFHRDFLINFIIKYAFAWNMCGYGFKEPKG